MTQNHKAPYLSITFLFLLCLISSLATQAASGPKKPIVILLSFDGFRFGYQFKTPTPNIHRLIHEGTEADLGLIPVFPTLTFPNHYSIATGLYPAHHGIVNNDFYEPETGDKFTMRSHEPKWWLGEPLWQTVVKNGLKAAVYMWPGGEVKKNSWTCPPQFCPAYNKSVPFEDRVDAILRYMDLPQKDVPSFVSAYFSDPDTQGHKKGPDDPDVTEAVAGVDKIIGRLITGLEKRGLFGKVHLIVVGDHGMANSCNKKLIYLDELAPWVNIPASWVECDYELAAIRPSKGHDPAKIVAKMNEGLESGNVSNGKYVKFYVKEELPSRLHYTGSDRIAPIIGMVGEGYGVLQRKDVGARGCGGVHGYDNALFSMRSIFIGHGPKIAKGRKVPSFLNIEIYNLITSILDIKGAPNNGSDAFKNSILLPGI